MKRTKACLFILLFVALIVQAADFDFSNIKKNISEFTLKNGLKFILFEDHSVPIATFITYANVGGSDEKIGIYGISHFLEHMAFKGTSTVGTKNVKAEKKIFQQMDALFEDIRREQNSISPNQVKLTEMNKKLTALSDEARKHVVPNEYDTILKQHGCVGMNAGTGADATMYFFSLPSNKLELWAHLESARFTDPVFREYYRERNVIAEERRMYMNMPVRKMIEELPALAFKDHPYRVSVLGPMSNIQNITRSDMKRYFRENYSAKNLVIGIAGDIYPKELKKMAQKYFSRLRPGNKNDRLFTKEPPQIGEKRMKIFEDTQPWLAIGFHIPSQLHKDFNKFSVLNNIITSGRSSRLQKKLVTDKKSALALISFAGFPGNKYSSLFLALALPNSGHTTDELEKEIFAELEKLKTEPVTQEELTSAKTRMKVQVIRGMNSRMGLIMQLLSSEVLQGSWQKVFEELAEIEKVAAADIQELAKKYFTEENRTVIRMEKKKEVKK